MVPKWVPRTVEFYLYWYQLLKCWCCDNTAVYDDRFKVAPQNFGHYHNLCLKHEIECQMKSSSFLNGNSHYVPLEDHMGNASGMKHVSKHNNELDTGR